MPSELDDFAKFCGALRVESGRPLVLEPFQRLILSTYFDGTRETLVLIPKKNGKALALDTPVPIPGGVGDGWSTMGDLRVGDKVYDEAGVERLVVAATLPMHGRPCYRVRFSDGAEIVADADHLWRTRTLKSEGAERLWTTAEVAKTVSVRADGARNHSVPMPEALQGQDLLVPVPPYVLGAWLGDGAAADGRITFGEAFVREEIARCGRTIAPVMRAGQAEASTVYGLKAQLRELGVLGRKHIPSLYLRASPRQRLELLQGLLDTDGYISERGQVELVTVRPALRDGALELIRTLGLKPMMSEDRARLDGRDCGPRWRIRFHAPSDVPVFRMPRKRIRQRLAVGTKARSRTRQIVAVELVDSVPVRCIQTSAPSGMFLAGREMVPTHNSTLLAALALYHLFVTDDAECVIAAASRDQAQILLNQARGMVRRSPGFEAEFVCKQREIVSRRGDGRTRVLAADADTADGILPSLALVDELHRHRSAELYGVFRDGLGPRDGQQITISTAGDDESSPLGLIRSKMRRERRVEVPEADGWAYGKYVSAGGQMVMHEWCLDRDADQSDMGTVKRANPASWHTVETLRERFESPSTTWWQWARFACGVWVPGDEESAISADEWRGRFDANLTVPGDARWFLGVDLGWKWDTTALVPVAAVDDRLFVKDPEILEPPGDGTALDVNAILDAIYAWRTRTGGRTVVLDPNFGGEQLAQTLEARDFEVVSHPQDPSPMADASQRLYEAVRSGRLTHDGNETLANHIYAACRKVVGGERWRLVKPARRKLPIDGAVALAMAVSVAENPPANMPPMVAFV